MDIKDVQDGKFYVVKDDLGVEYNDENAERFNDFLHGTNRVVRVISTSTLAKDVIICGYGRRIPSDWLSHWVPAVGDMVEGRDENDECWTGPQKYIGYCYTTKYPHTTNDDSWMMVRPVEVKQPKPEPTADDRIAELEKLVRWLEGRLVLLEDYHNLNWDLVGKKGGE